MDPAYVQAASLQGPQAQHQVNFTNLSSQQLNPGTLVHFHQVQDRSRQPMPFTDGDIQTDRSAIARQDSEQNNVSNLPRRNTLSQYFHMNDPNTKDAVYKTQEQRSWNVSDYMLQQRATDMF